MPTVQWELLADAATSPAHLVPCLNTTHQTIVLVLTHIHWLHKHRLGTLTLAQALLLTYYSLATEGTQKWTGYRERERERERQRERERETAGLKLNMCRAKTQQLNIWDIEWKHLSSSSTSDATWIHSWPKLNPQKNIRKRSLKTDSQMGRDSAVEPPAGNSCIEKLMLPW